MFRTGITDTDSGRWYYAGAGVQTQWKPPPGSTSYERFKL